MARLMFGVFVAGQIADGLLTCFGVSRGFQEANPLLAAMFPMIGPGLTMLFAKSAAVFFGGILYHLKSFRALLLLTVLSVLVPLTWVLVLLRG